MLRTLPDLPPGVLGFEAVGEVHSDDYRDVLRPAIEAAAAAGGVRLVYVLGPEFTGYSSGAAWEDTKMGVGHLSAFERTAVVTDVGWVEHLVGGFSWMVPGELRRFSLAERDEAVRWAAGIEAEPATESSPDDGPSPASEPTPVPGVAVSEPAAVDPEDHDAPIGVPAPADADPVAPDDFVAVTEPAAAEPVVPEPATEETPVPVQPQAAPAAMPPVAPSVPEQWAADPTGRHQHRWWNGSAWTEHVADNGVSSVDPIG
jgi:hypothetical protein